MCTDIPEIATKIWAPKRRAHSSGCQEAPIDFGGLSVQEFLRYGNLEIMSGDYHDDSEGAPLVHHFLCRMPLM